MNEKFLKAMFNSSQLPIIDFGLADISQQAQKLAGKLSISGVQPKLSVKLDKKRNMLIVVNEGGEYILKPQTGTFPNIPENEHCCMDIAEALGIETPPHCLLALKDKSLAYVIKRFDRRNGDKIHQEEFSQLLGKEKYIGSVEQIAKKISEVSTAPGYDLQLFFERVLLNFILGNGDAHLKNYTMRYAGEERRLSPAYDIVCSRLVISEEKEESALDINGKRNRITREDFEKLADHLKIPIKVRYENFQGKFKIMKKIIQSSKLDQESQKKFLHMIKERLHRLELLE